VTWALPGHGEGLSMWSGRAKEMSAKSELAIRSDAIDAAPLDAGMLRVLMAAAAYQARRVARTLKLSDVEREDAEQEILLALLERRRFFDPARGPWPPFVHRIARQAAQSVADNLVAARKLYTSLEEPKAEVSLESEARRWPIRYTIPLLWPRWISLIRSRLYLLSRHFLPN
jgi:hypothetical protein